MKSRILQCYKKTYKFVKAYLAEIICSILFLVASSASFLLLPYLIKILIDDIIIKGDISRLYMFGLSALGVVLAGNLFSFLARYLFANFSEKIAIDARRHLFSKLVSYELAFFQKHQLGDLVSRLRDDSGVVHSLFSFVIATLLNNIFSIIFIVTILLKMNLILGLIVVCTIPVYILINNHFAKVLRANAHKTRKEQALLMNFIYDIFSKIILIKNFVQENNQTNKLVKICTNLKMLAVRGEVSGYVASSMTQLTTQIVGIVILFLGGTFVINDHLTPGGLIAFYSYLSNLFSPILMLTQSNIQINQVVAGIERYFEYLDTPPIIEDLVAGSPVSNPKGQITLLNVNFSYGNDPILTDVNLEIMPSEKVAILGKSGIGKTTLALLLKRFFDPEQGQILLDGQDLRELQLGQLRQNIGYLTQDPMIINGTIRENLLVGTNLPVTEDQIWQALNLAELRDFVDQLPDKLETILENNGARLSGGQKQRLSIARLVLSNPAVVIFDEAFSHLDVETERQIWENFKIWLADKTTIFITHQLWDPEFFDRLILLNKTVQSEGHFTELQDNQFLQQILANDSKVS